MKKFVLAYLNFLLLSTWAYPSGAPLDRCQSMMPGHDVDPINDKSPYTLDVRPLNSNDFQVTLSSTDDKFKGFLLEARGKWNGRSIGKWTTDVKRTKTINCFKFDDSAVTHNLDDDMVEGEDSSFRNVTFKWTKPNSDKINRVKFIATVVRKFSQIYLNVSASIKLKTYTNLNLN